METEIYTELIKPFFAPPSWLFGPVWSILYTLIFISFGFVFLQIFQKKIPRKILWPFILNLFFNGLFTTIQFGLEIYWLASIDILLVLATVLWCMKSIWPYHRWVTYIQIPYLLWVGFATILQVSITILNW